MQVIFYIHAVLFEPTKRISVRLRAHSCTSGYLCFSLCFGQQFCAANAKSPSSCVRRSRTAAVCITHTFALCASSRNKIAPAHSLFRRSQRVGKLSTAAERRDFPCDIIIAKGRLASLETIIEKKRELLAKIFSKKRFLQKKRQAFRDLALPNPCIMRLAVTRFTKFFSNRRKEFP